MKFIVGYPEVHGLEANLLDSGPIGDVAAAAEQSGFDGFALTEHPIPGANWLAHGGHQTARPVRRSRVRGRRHRAVAPPHLPRGAPYRNPFVTAKAASTLDRLSGGRFILGVGTGYLKTEFFALGVDFDERNELFDECLDVMAKAGRPSRSRTPGTHFDARNVVHKPRPAHTHPDLDRRQLETDAPSRRRARAQGWMPMGGSPEMAKSPAHRTSTPSTEVLAAMVGEVKELAGDRAGEIDFCVSTTTPPSTQTSPSTSNVTATRSPSWPPSESTGCRSMRHPVSRPRCSTSCVRSGRRTAGTDASGVRGARVSEVARTLVRRMSRGW